MTCISFLILPLVEAKLHRVEVKLHSVEVKLHSVEEALHTSKSIKAKPLNKAHPSCLSEVNQNEDTRRIPKKG
jgi:hypothetical protein